MGEVLPGPVLVWVGLLLEEGIFFFCFHSWGGLAVQGPRPSLPSGLNTNLVYKYYMELLMHSWGE